MRIIWAYLLFSLAAIEAAQPKVWVVRNDRLFGGMYIRDIQGSKQPVSFFGFAETANLFAPDSNAYREILQNNEHAIAAKNWFFLGSLGLIASTVITIAATTSSAGRGSSGEALAYLVIGSLTLGGVGLYFYASEYKTAEYHLYRAVNFENGFIQPSPIMPAANEAPTSKIIPNRILIEATASF